jgi:hypothetical protein
MKLPPGVFQDLLIGQALIPLVINVIVNVALGVFTFSSADSVQTWATDKGAVADSIGTCFFLPFITCLIATPIVRFDVARGRVERIPATEMPQWLPLLSGPVILRALKFGLAGLLLLAGPVFGLYAMLSGDSMETSRFIAIKASFAGVFGFLVTPLIAIVEMVDTADHAVNRR